MKLSDLVDILSQANLPIAYRAFETGHVPQTPYLIYFESHPDIKRADDVDYHFMNSNEGYEGKLKVPHITEEFATKILGELKDEQTGVLTEKGDASTKPFAIMFEFSGDQNKTRYVLYYCSASRPSNGSATKSGTTVNERELSFKASPRPLDSVVKRSITSADKKEVYNAWFTSVYEPTALG